MTKIKQKRPSVNLKVAEKFLSILAPDEDRFTFQTFSEGRRGQRNVTFMFDGTLERNSHVLMGVN